MNLCSNGHDEVCYEGRYCPACGLKNELSAANEDNYKLQDEIKELKNQVGG